MTKIQTPSLSLQVPQQQDHPLLPTHQSPAGFALQRATALDNTRAAALSVPPAPRQAVVRQGFDTVLGILDASARKCRQKILRLDAASMGLILIEVVLMTVKVLAIKQDSKTMQISAEVSSFLIQAGKEIANGHQKPDNSPSSA
jgi:hypothetical protein